MDELLVLEKRNNKILNRFIRDGEIDNSTDLAIICDMLDVKVSNEVLDNFICLEYDKENNLKHYRINNVSTRKLFNVMRKIERKLEVQNG